MLLQNMISYYHNPLKYFEIINGVVFGRKTLCEVLVIKYVFYFTVGPLIFKLYQFKRGQWILWTPCTYGSAGKIISNVVTYKVVKQAKALNNATKRCNLCLWFRKYNISEFASVAEEYNRAPLLD